MKFSLYFFFIFTTLFVGACVPYRLSSAVSFQFKNSEMKEWLKSPKYAFVEAYVYFDDTLDKSVIFGIDQELLEGTISPLTFSGSDWMGLVGLQRDGKVWIASGTSETMNGKPSKDRNWKFLNLKKHLQPNTWYRLYTIADFSKRYFVSFSVEGPDINQTFDLSSYPLDYPNMLPFDQRSMTTLIWAIGGKALGGTEESGSKIYFDDVRSGIIKRTPNGQFEEISLYTQNFEVVGNKFNTQPINYMDVILTNNINLSDYKENTWYLERESSLSKPHTAHFARSGDYVAQVDVTLKDVSYNEWLSDR